MAKILALGDPHFKVSNFMQIDELLPLLFAFIKQAQPDIIVVLGDTLHTHEMIHVSPLTKAVQFLYDLGQMAEVFLLIGNHDLKNNQQFFADEHPFVALKYWGSHFHVINKTASFIRHGQRLTFVPYVPPGRFHEALSHEPLWKESTCIFAHQEFAGAQMNAITSQEGDLWEENCPLVISGHIHQYQELQTNLIYAGSLMQHGFGDCVSKSISLLTLTKDQYNHERIFLNLTSKKHQKISYTDIDTYLPPSNCELKITINATKSEIISAKKHPKILLWQKQGIHINYKEIKSFSGLNPENANDLELQNVKRQNFGHYFYHSLPKKELQEKFVELFGEP